MGLGPLGYSYSDIQWPGLYQVWRHRQPLGTPGPVGSRLTSLWSGMGMPGQPGHGARLLEGNVHLLIPAAHPALSIGGLALASGTPELCTQGGDTWISLAP